MMKLMVVASSPYYREIKEKCALLKRGIISGYPSYEEVVSASLIIKKRWAERRGDQLLERASAITGLEWMRSEIRAYVIGPYKSSWSDPLTVSMTILDEGEDYVLGDLVHEALHNLVMDSCGEWIKEYLGQAYP